MSEQIPTATIAPDDSGRRRTAVAPDDPKLQPVGLLSNTCTIPVSAEDTAGRRQRSLAAAAPPAQRFRIENPPPSA